MALESTKPLVYAAVALVALVTFRKALSSKDEGTVPTVGPSGISSSYRDGWKYLHHAAELIQRGYALHGDRVFRVAQPWHWEYIVCSPKLITEVGNAPDSVLSFDEGANLAIQGRITMGHEILDNPWHLKIIRTTLTRNLHRCFPDVRDEIVCSFDEILNLDASEWKNLMVLPAMMDIVARVSNRLFVGLPICREKAYLDNNIQFTMDVMRSGNRINILPPFLRPILGPFISGRINSFNTAMQYLGPVVEERIKKDDELGTNYPGRPNDAISWMLDIAEPKDRTVHGFVMRILQINMAAIHTSSMTISHALFDLTLHPEYIQPLREEVEAVVQAEGWNKAALNNMAKLDSFMRESQRIRPLSMISMNRRVIAKEGFRFSDGSFLPYGAYLCVAAQPTHLDGANYENPTTFDGFRFAREREEYKQPHVESNDLANTDIFKRHMVSTAIDHLPFGNGKHACPGRFFAATELKAMFAHIVLNYDIKAEVEGVRPADMIYGDTQTPNPMGRVFIRKRQ
ncbi:cytochrome P450 [Roridomyces roridus]|uniref:Cytochrome P450 n=1 Tax=Roridomyces roridus TaxID=1738132 RepID=A0AAD7CC43_9AGAR|nr:cytochrome P450 [Roridomyces roridus]